MDMLRDDTEGLWCDQLCIDQSNASEKHCTIGMMDHIYASARLVVVVLDDLVFDPSETECIRAKAAALLPSHGSPPNWNWNEATDSVHLDMQNNPLLRQVYQKIIRAKWFTGPSVSMNYARDVATSFSSGAREGNPAQKLS